MFAQGCIGTYSVRPVSRPSFPLSLKSCTASVCMLQVASTVVVGVQESSGYGVGFGIPTIAFGVAIFCFILGAIFKLYVKVPPEGSPLDASGQCSRVRNCRV